MELTPQEQIVELINKSRKILAVTHTNPDGDALGSLLALYLALTKKGKEVTAVCADPVPATYAFLPTSDKITPSLSGSRDFIVTLDCSQKEVDKLSYNIEDNKLNIIITPLKGEFSQEEVSFSYGSYKYDAIFVLDCPDLERLNSLYENNTEMFFNTPVVNIDHHAGNEYFGQINLVDLNATSTSEILYNVLEALDSQLIDEDIATCLLAGIITDTRSFQNTNTTPKAMNIAAQLVAAGARQQEIIRHIYKTKPVSQLKLWGRVLAGIKNDPEIKLAWSTISLKDFAECGSKPEEASGVIDELMSSIPGTEIALLLSEKEEGEISGSLRTIKGVDALKIASLFGGGGHHEAAGFVIKGKSLEEAEKEVVSQIKALRTGQPLSPAPQALEEIKPAEEPILEEASALEEETAEEEVPKEETAKEEAIEEAILKEGEKQEEVSLEEATPKEKPPAPISPEQTKPETQEEKLTPPKSSQEEKTSKEASNLLEEIKQLETAALKKETTPSIPETKSTIEITENEEQLPKETEIPTAPTVSGNVVGEEPPASEGIKFEDWIKKIRESS